MNLKGIFSKLRPYRAWIVWVLRIIVGATFVLSGISKSIDIWGFAYKIEEYFIVWNINLPHTLYVIGALGLATAEFVLGAMLVFGCYRRTSSWLLLLMMFGMLPLSAYIFIVSPVADCGCFGDFWKISNGATFVKNIFLTVALIYLAIVNRRVAGLYNPYWQWLVATACFVFCVAVALWGYNVQPLVDFRSFPVGTELVSESDDTEDDVVFGFIYEKDGQEKMFPADSLPDSTWVYVDRQLLSGSIENTTAFSITEDGEDVTEDVTAAEGPQLIITVPDHRRAGISFTYTVNELREKMDSIGGSLIEVVAMDNDEIDRWRDLSNASYPIYRGEPTMVKELVRGVMGAVYISDGKIVWKRTLSSVDLETVDKAIATDDSLDSMATDGSHVLFTWTALLIVILAVILMADKSFMMLKRFKKNSRTKKNA